MERKLNLEINKIFHLEDSVIMYGIYNAETVENIVDTLEKMPNRTTQNEKLFMVKLTHWFIGINQRRAGTLCYKLNFIH